MTFLIDRPPVVLDASVAVGRLLTPNPVHDVVLGQWVRDGRARLVPATFWSETANALLVGNRIDVATTQAYLADLAAYGVEVADRGLLGVLDAIQLASRHGLTVYDALYLQLVLDTDATLATLDRDLARAAHTEGVELELA